ncbi:hypothetical protein MKX67_08855 [Cytobacillus sp. FSL W7-1323]|uniref:hypothetical protein n=1 Tax=Cytobacillus sp. FSL W7-1323 TaxID=2921700 RepID=UPI0031593EFD
MDYSLEKSTMERYDIQIKNEDGWRCAWAIISISNDGVFNAQTDCGNFSYSWGSFGECFKSFLIDVCSKDSSYLYDKISSSERQGKIDVEKTIDNMKKRVIENRKEAGLRWLGSGNLTADEARELWDSLDFVQDNHDDITAEAFSSIFHYELPDKERGKVFSDEWWYDDILVTTDDQQATAFCEVVAPIFAEILKEELKAKETA